MHALPAGVRLVVDERIRERNGAHPCDKRRARADYARQRSAAVRIAAAWRGAAARALCGRLRGLTEVAGELWRWRCVRPPTMP
jgi:hypothetical protein